MKTMDHSFKLLEHITSGSLIALFHLANVAPDYCSKLGLGADNQWPLCLGL